MDAAGADAAARAPDEEGFASATFAGWHLQRQSALLEKAGGGRVDAQGQYGCVGPFGVVWDLGDERHFQNDVLLESGVFVDATWNGLGLMDDVVARV